VTLDVAMLWLLDCHRRSHPRVNQALEEVHARRQWGGLGAAALFGDGAGEQGRIAAIRNRRQPEQVVQHLDTTAAEVGDLREGMVLAALVEGKTTAIFGLPLETATRQSRAAQPLPTHRLGVSHSTVTHHLANVRSKVRATTRHSPCGSSRRPCPKRRRPADGL
jgi:hypothetical protein